MCANLFHNYKTHYEKNTAVNTCCIIYIVTSLVYGGITVRKMLKDWDIWEKIDHYWCMISYKNTLKKVWQITG